VHRSNNEPAWPLEADTGTSEPGQRSRQRFESGEAFGQPDDSATTPTEAAYLRITFRAARPERN